jgi:hypothetical protein
MRTKDQSACTGDDSSDLCFQSHGDDQDSDDSVEGHQDIVETAHCAVQILHGVLDRQLLTVEIHARHLHGTWESAGKESVQA